MEVSMKQAAQHCLPTVRAIAKRPWISDRTLQLIDQRTDACTARNLAAERRLDAQVKHSVKRDRDAWLDDLLV